MAERSAADRRADRYLTAELDRASEMTEARFETAVRRVREDLTDPIAALRAE